MFIAMLLIIGNKWEIIQMPINRRVGTTQKMEYYLVI